MMLPLIFLLASERPTIELIRPPVGGNRPVCFDRLVDGDGVVDRTKVSSRFFFDGKYAFEVFHEGDGAGNGFYRRYGSRWCELERGGGPLDERSAVDLGVPAAVAHRLIAMPH